MKNTTNFLLAVMVLTVLVFSSCKKSSGGEANDEELITTMKLSFSSVGGGPPKVFTVNDADGPGGADPVKDIIQLAPNTTYTVSMELFNSTTSPAENITAEILAEREAHRLYYIPSSGAPLTIGGFDLDANNVPLGLTSEWTTGAASSGTVTITLRHYPGTPPDKQISDPVNSPKSSTDFVVTFSYTAL
ncbi:MAG: hypothetical protein EOO06_16595 [Chitinophagaceae bacterium]|nr:MAG: hypothetical protein EOO06_16595 [Chitinophagaceae bacterium]